MFKRRILTLLGIHLLAMVLAFAAYFLLGAAIDPLQNLFGDNPLVLILASSASIGLALLVLSALGAAITMAIIDEDLGVRAALGLGIQRFASFLWVFLLVGFILSGGYLVFFIPGVIFTVWFIFAQFILAEEDLRGMEALLKSRAYVQGHFWGVLGRLAVVAVASGMLSAIPLLGLLFALFAGPFTLIYYHEVYRDLVAIKGRVVYPASRKEKSKWLFAGASGYLFVLLGTSLLLGPALLQGIATFSTPFEQSSFSSEDRSGFTGEGSLRLAKLKFVTHEPITVRVTAPDNLPPDAWVGIIPSYVPHGDEVRNDQHDLSFQYLNGQTRTSLQFYAPPVPGNYDLRMHDSDSNGQEIASLSFRVDNPSATDAPSTSGASLDLSQTDFTPGAQVVVIFTAPEGLADDAWVGIVPAHIPHGDEARNDQNDLGYHYLNGQTLGTLSFTAPVSPGQYDLRMHNTDRTGLEIASTSFTVTEQQPRSSLDNDGPEHLSLDRDYFQPGDSIPLYFSGIASPASKDWISLYKVGDTNQNYGQYFYLQGKPSGSLKFSAPQQPGDYEFRLFLNWPDGGYADVARSVRFTVGTSPPDARSYTPVARESASLTSPKTIRIKNSGANADQLMVYIYAVNHRGLVKFNGSTLYPIKGERDMNYNYSGSIHLLPGSNFFDVTTQALPDSWLNKLKLKLYRNDWQSGEEEVFAEWTLDETGGQARFEVIFDN